MTMRLRAFRLIAAVFATAASLVVPVGASASSDDLIEVSPDGTVFTQQFSGLFDDVVLVPQELVEETFLIRNSSDQDGYVRVVLVNSHSPDPAFAEALGVGLVLPGARGSEVPLAAGKPCAQLLHNYPLAAGATVPMTARMRLADLSGVEAQGASTRFALQLVMTPETVDSNATDCIVSSAAFTSVTPSVTAPSFLGLTGGTASVTAVIIGISLAAAGLAIVVARRRQKESE